MLNWIDKQFKHVIAQWNKAIEVHYPQYVETWRNPIENFRSLHEEWNLLDAVEIVEWDRYISTDAAIVLDLGDGTGWLSAYLFNRKKIRRTQVQL